MSVAEHLSVWSLGVRACREPAAETALCRDTLAQEPLLVVALSCCSAFQGDATDVLKAYADGRESPIHQQWLSLLSLQGALLRHLGAAQECPGIADEAVAFVVTAETRLLAALEPPSGRPSEPLTLAGAAAASRIGTPLLSPRRASRPSAGSLGRLELCSLTSLCPPLPPFPLPCVPRCQGSRLHSFPSLPDVSAPRPVAGGSPAIASGLPVSLSKPPPRGPHVPPELSLPTPKDTPPSGLPCDRH